MTGIDAARALDVWVRLVRDEELYRAFVGGRHAQLAASHGLAAADLAILDEFRDRPGTRWNLENIRFRAAFQTAIKLRMWLPLTSFVLTGNSEDWLIDLAFEYMAYHRWEDLGPLQLTECQRFGEFVRERVMIRRRWNPLLEHVLGFELRLIELLKRTGDVPAHEWPPMMDEPPGDEALSVMRLRPGPVASVVEVPVDITPWLAGDLRNEAIVDEPLRLLVWVPSLTQTHKLQKIGEGARIVFERCTGAQTGAELAAALAQDVGAEPDDIVGLLRRWVHARALRA